MYKLKIVTNRNLHADLVSKFKEILTEYSKNEYLEGFEIDSVILREKDLDDYEYEKLLLSFLELEKELGLKERIKLCVHTKFELAIKYNISSVHLSMEDFEKLFISDKKKIFFESFKEIGVSVHSKEEAYRARVLGANYLIYGHIFETACKPGLPPRGLALLKDICESVDIPVFAIGGINKDNAYKAIENKAFGVCMMSGI